MLGHLTFIVTDLVAILMRTSRHLKKTHHSAAVCSFSWNRRRAGRENHVKRVLFERFWKRAPLCSRLLVLLWFRTLRRLRLPRRVLKKLTTLQPFAFCSSYFTLISRAFETTETNTKPVHQPFNISVSYRKGRRCVAGGYLDNIVKRHVYRVVESSMGLQIS